MKLESGDFSKHDATAEIREDTIDSFDFVKVRNLCLLKEKNLKPKKIKIINKRPKSNQQYIYLIKDSYF